MAFEKPSTAYAEAIAYVTGLVRDEPSSSAEREQAGLGPMRALLDALGNPERDLACVHVAGSKGKGSTALLAEQVLRAAGLVTGAYTSPHLVSWTERIRIAGAEFPERDFAEAIFAVRDVAGRGPPPSFFDVLTAAAFLAFRDAGVDVTILETGLGGRLDATNVVAAPLVTCITTVEIEHADRLGGTLAAIAGEKAGIIKRRAPLVIGRLHPEAAEVVRARAHALDAPIWSLAEHAVIEPRRRGGWRIALDLPGCAIAFEIAHPSAVMAEDAALAAACAALTRRIAADRLERSTRALASCRVPGRLDLLDRRPLTVVDGAHTAESVRCLVQMLDALDAPRLDLVLSVTRGKDPRMLLAPLLARAVHVTITCAEPSRSMGAEELAAALEGLPGAERLEVIADPVEALTGAAARTPRMGALCATGSLYLAGAALRLLGDENRRTS